MTDITIQMGHGSGGALSAELVKEVFQAPFANPWLNAMNDSAILPSEVGRIALTTDSYVVSPLFFPGGDIGRLAVCGTVNDLSVVGARPKYLCAGFIIEEGFSIAELKRIVNSMADTAQQAGVCIVAGDTKVIERGGADKLFINTSGVGFVPPDRELNPANISSGDKIIVSGTLGEHGIAIASQREGLSFQTAVRSDCAPLNDFIDAFYIPGIICMRDPTRGGLAASLNELAQQSNVTIIVHEDKIPLRAEVSGACRMLGLDPFCLANEGKVVVVVKSGKEEQVLRLMQQHPLGHHARIIGEAIEGRPGMVTLQTLIGAKRIMPMPVGEQLPRIC